jgi:transposase-like protein
MAKRRKRHTEEFKREAVLALESRGDRSIEDVAKGLGLSASQLHAWRKTQGIDARRSKTGETVEQELAWHTGAFLQEVRMPVTEASGRAASAQRLTEATPTSHGLERRFKTFGQSNRALGLVPNFADCFNHALARILAPFDFQSPF